MGAALAAVPWGAATAAVSSTRAVHAAKGPKLAQEGRGKFWECPAKTTSVLVAVNRLTLRPGQELTVSFVVKNLGTAACNYVAPYAGVAPGATVPTLTAGPCGSMVFEVEGAHHADVWPGLAGYNCPALGFAQLQPGASVIGSGTWAQTAGGGTRRVRAGAYTLVIDGRFSFPLRVEAA